jgi:hypothetical protein
VTRCAILEYARAVRERYLRSSKKGKAEILDEFVAATRLHRKAAIRLLNRVEGAAGRPKGKRRGRPRLYGLEVAAALRVAWEASDRLCSRRLCAFLGELVRILKADGELAVSAETEDQLARLSPSTVDRMTRRWRVRQPRRGLATTKPGTLLKNAIPIKTFTEWQDTRPGFLEADLVAHCGESAEGFYLTTLSAVDVATGWCEPVAVWGEGQQRVGGAVHQVRERLPVPMLGLDSDNGSEFINGGCTTTAGVTTSPSPALGPTRRTIAATWSKRTGAWSGEWWATTASAQRRPTRLWITSIPCCASTSTSSNR